MQTVRLGRLQKRLGFYLKLSKGTSCILTKNLSVFCPCPGNLSGSELKRNRLNCLTEKVSRQHSLKAVVQLVITALSSAMKEKHDMRNVVFPEEKVVCGSVSKLGWQWREQSGLLEMQKTIGDHTLRAKTTPLQASPGENVNSFEMGELEVRNVVEVLEVADV